MSIENKQFDHLTELVDYILKKSKLSKKVLLVEILYRLDNIYDVLYSDSTKPRIPRK